MTNQVKYFVTPDNHSHYRVNYDTRKIIRICNNKLTEPDFDTTITQIEAYVKCNKHKWIEVENRYYRSRPFEWFFKGEEYETCEPLFSEKMLVENTQIGEANKFMGNYLCFHNGEIWATHYYGNYYPQMPLFRVDINGKLRKKWTNVANCRNFRKKESSL